MIDFLGSLLCRIRGHNWRRPRKADPILGPVRVCSRCGLTQPIRKRKGAL